MNSTTTRITQEDLQKFAKRHYRDMPYISGYCDIADELGVCVGVGSIQGEYWYFEQKDEAADYVLKNYNFEDDMLAMKDDTFSLLQTRVNNGTAVSLPPEDPHTLAAHYALAYPEDWQKFVEDVRAAASPYHDSEVAAMFPDFIKESEEAVTSAEQDMRRDFINGDYHGNFEGIERKMCKLLEADEVDVQGYDAVSITWDTETLKDRLADSGRKRDVRLAKTYALDVLVSDAYHYKNKERAEREKRKAERERVAAYQKVQADKAAAERLAMLDAIRR